MFFTITNCQIVCSRSLTHRINYEQETMSVRLLKIKLASERGRISAVIAKMFFVRIGIYLRRAKP